VATPARQALRVLAALTLGACTYATREPTAPLDGGEGASAAMFSPYSPELGATGAAGGNSTGGVPGTSTMMAPSGAGGMASGAGATTGAAAGSIGFVTLDFAPSAMSADGHVVAGDILGPVADARLWMAGPPSRTVDVGQAVQAAGLSADGAIVVGTVKAPIGCVESGGATAVRWTAAGGAQPVGMFPVGADAWSFAAAVSGDGKVVVGGFGQGNAPCTGMPGASVQREQGYWTPAGTVAPLGPLSGDTGSLGFAVSTDGTTALGVSMMGSSGTGHIFVASARLGPIALTPPRASVHLSEGGGVDIVAGVFNAFISADGSVVAGTLIDGPEGSASFGWHAFRWTQIGGLVLIDETASDSAVVALSADGATIVGYQSADPTTLLSDTNQGFRWTSVGGALLLQSNGAATPYVANASAQVIVGGGEQPVLWAQSPAAVPLAAAVPQLASTICTSPVVTAISDDGRVVAGTCGAGPAGWVAQRLGP